MWVGSQRSLTWICKEHMKSWMNAYCWRRQQPMPLPMGNCQSLPPGWVQMITMCTGVYQPLTSVCKEAHCSFLLPDVYSGDCCPQRPSPTSKSFSWLWTTHSPRSAQLLPHHQSACRPSEPSFSASVYLVFLYSLFFVLLPPPSDVKGQATLDTKTGDNLFFFFSLKIVHSEPGS